MTMMFRLMTTFLTLTLATSLAGSADAKHRYRPKRVDAPPPAYALSPDDLWHKPSPQAPARMIQVRPGVWISSYGCIMDEGYGRVLPCDVDVKSH
jgi:hypothetical protein